MNGRYRYLLARLRDLMIAGGVVTAALLLCALVTALRGGVPVWPELAALAALLLMGVAVWLFVARPYRKREQALERMLRGYAGGEEEMGPVTLLGPGDERLLGELRQMLSPSQMFKLNKRQAQYLALQNQINPHFLYNTLESIRSEAMMAGLSSVADMTEALANFFRYTISKVENLVSVEDELQNCETYFHIQQYRFGDRLELTVRCAPEDREELYRCRLPKLTLQPILENSIIHGTELKVGKGHLTIYLQRTGERLLIQVSDDGVGMDEETLARLNGKLGKGGLVGASAGSQRGGVALVNVDNRIRLLFGEEYGLHVYSMPELGTTVEITLPIITSDRDVRNREVLG